jgi:hypothetical protein
MKRSVTYLGLLSFAMIGCAGVPSKGQFTHVGEADPVFEKQVNKRIKDVKKLYEAPEAEVKVFIDSLPEGVVYSDGVMSVADGYKHELLGKFSASPDAIVYYAGISYAFKYKAAWRNAYCNFHSVIPPLMYSPTYWAAGCFVSGTLPHEELINSAKNIALSAGGDMVLGSFMASRPEKSTALGFSGWILKMDPQFKGKPIKSKPKELKEKAKA